MLVAFSTCVKYETTFSHKTVVALDARPIATWPPPETAARPRLPHRPAAPSPANRGGRKTAASPQRNASGPRLWQHRPAPATTLIFEVHLLIDVVTITRLQYVGRHQASDRSHRPRPGCLPHPPYRGELTGFPRADAFNEYSHTLLTNPLLVPIEIALLLVFLLHIFKTVRMLLANRAARPVGYEQKRYAGTPEPQDLRVLDR